MTSRKNSITLLILLTSVLSGCWSCKDFIPNHGCNCEGSNGRPKITCMQETTFPSLAGLFPKLTRQLTITTGNIQSLSAADFDGLDKLEILNLDANGLTAWDFAAIAGLQLLTQLSLKRNKIQNVTNVQGVLEMKKLETINLDSNKIRSIGPSSFPDLPKLKTVNFKANLIATISNNAFGKVPIQRDVKKRPKINLESNQLHCNCMRGFKRWANQNAVILQNAVCTGVGIELPNFEDFESCSGTGNGDDSSEFPRNFSCYSCEPTTNEDDCSIRSCDKDKEQKTCLTEREEVDGVRLISKGCIKSDDCFNRGVFGDGNKKVDCCHSDQCNAKLELFCESESVRNEKGRFVWQKTNVGEEDELPCPGDRSSIAVRQCTTEDGVAMWEDPNDDNCPEASDITEELAILMDTYITDVNVVGLSMRLENVSKRSPEYNPMDVDHTVNIAQRLLRHGADNQEREIIGNCVSALSNLFETPENRLVGAERYYKSVQRYISVVEELGTLVNLKKNNGSLREVRRNLAIVSVSISQADFKEIRIEAESQLTSDSSVSYQASQDVSDDNTPMDTIVLPSTIFSGFKDNPQTGGDRATFVVYQQDTIFKVIASAARDSGWGNNVTKNSTRLQVVNSRILSASIGNLTLRNLADPVLITFNHEQPNSTKKPLCVFWDFANNSWSSDGCLVKETVTNSYTVCQCDHLTNFALLLDVYDTGPSQTNQEAVAILNILSFVGCAISFFGLVLTIVIYCIFSKLRKDVPSKILLNLCGALACLNVTFIIGVYSLENPDLCKAIAVLMHYFLLSSMAWMSVEAFYMYLALVVVFRTYIERFMLKAMLIAWGIPLVIVAITLGVNNTNNYGSQTNNKICWLTRIPFYVAALAPVVLVLIGNMIIFVLVIKQICGMSKKNLNKSETMPVIQQLRGVIGVFILLGITWTFAVFAIGEASLAFQYLFTIFNSLQGLFIFIFYCLMKTDVQKRLFCCCPSTFDPSTSSQRSSKATYSTTGRGRSTFRNAINAVFATNIKKRGAYAVAKAVPHDSPMPEIEDYSTSKHELNQIELT